MDALDVRLLNILQNDFPVVPRPYREIGERLGITEAQVLQRLRSLVATGIIRRIGPVFDTRRLGHVSLLVAAAVPPERLDEVAAKINEFPQVTHNYGRDHKINLWFTLVCADFDEADRVIARIRAATGLEELEILPAEQLFKIRVNFAL